MRCHPRTELRFIREHLDDRWLGHDERQAEVRLNYIRGMHAIEENLRVCFSRKHKIKEPLPGE